LKSAHTPNKVDQLNFFLENQNLCSFFYILGLILSSVIAIKVQACWIKTIYFFVSLLALMLFYRDWCG